MCVIYSGFTFVILSKKAFKSPGSPRPEMYASFLSCRNLFEENAIFYPEPITGIKDRCFEPFSLLQCPARLDRVF